MNSLNPINNYNIPPMSSLTEGMIPNPMASLTDDSHYGHHHHNNNHLQLHQQQQHYNMHGSKVWPEDMGMGVVGLAPFVGAGSP